MELSWNPYSQVITNTAKPIATSFFPLQKLKGARQYLKQLLHAEYTWKKKVLRERRKIKLRTLTVSMGLWEESMVHLACAVNDAQVEEKCCYYCSSLEHFILDCPLVRNSKENTQLKLQGGDSIEEGSLNTSDENDNTQEPPGGGSQGIMQPKQTPFLNLDPFQHWV